MHGATLGAKRLCYPAPSLGSALLGSALTAAKQVIRAFSAM